MISVSEPEFEIIAHIMLMHIPDCKVMAFGSRYKWTAKDYSDLDLAIKCHQKLAPGKLDEIRDAFEESELPFHVDLLDYEDISSEFREIIDSGHEVLDFSKYKTPLGWKKTTLGEVTKWLSGGTPQKGNPAYWNGDIPWISAKTMTDGWIETSDLQITQEGLIAGSRMAPVNSILILVRGSGLYNKRSISIVREPVAFNQDIKCLIPIECILPKFLYYVLRANDRKLVGMLESTGIGAGKFDTDLLKKMYFPLPNTTTQQAIAATLSCLDDKIELNNKINANLEAQAQAIFKSWFVDFEPFQDGNFVESELGLIPEGWRVKILKQNCSLISKGITPRYDDNSDELVINQKCIRDNQINLTLARKHKPKRINEKWLQFGDVLINSTGQGTLGRVAQVTFAPQQLTADSHVTIVRPSTPEMIFFLGDNLCQKQSLFESMASGSTGQTDLPRERLQNLLMIIPPKKILEDYSEIIAPNKKMITQNMKESNILAAIRDALLPKLMSGEIEVPVDEKASA